MKESEEFLARRCLRSLLDDLYGNLDRIGRLLRQNLDVKSENDMKTVGNTSSQAHLDKDTPGCERFYRYAAEYWVTHLTSLAKPPEDLLLLANDLFDKPPVCLLVGIRY